MSEHRVSNAPRLVSRGPGDRDRRITLERNQSILLADPGQVWIIEAGTLEVQGSRFEHGVPVGARRPLCTLIAGQGAIGVDNRHSPGNQGWLAIATGKVVLRVVALDQLARAVLDGQRAAHNCVRCWALVIGDHLAKGTPPPASASRLAEDGEYELGKEEVLMPAADDLLWLRLDAGQLSVAGQDAVGLSESGETVLIGGRVWLQVESESAAIHAHRDADSVAMLTGGVATLHRLFAEHLEQVMREEEAAELERRKNSQALHQLETEMVSQELSQLLESAEQFALRDTPLLTALSVLGETIGVAIEPARASEDLNRVSDPIEPIARASRVRYRKILLEPRWWRFDLGPFLAFVGDERMPVALGASTSGDDRGEPARRPPPP
ncbi:MAG: hypothetical protein AAGC55_12635, partial [Myxococcota bacterium]